jgi:hypothetical protein
MKITRRAQFQAEMDRVVPWRALCARIASVYPQAGNGRRLVGVERMLRMYFLQHWFNLSDLAVAQVDPDKRAQHRRVIQRRLDRNRCRTKRLSASFAIARGAGAGPGALR